MIIDSVRYHKYFHFPPLPEQINSESFHPKRHQLNKFVWPFLEKRALPAFQLIRNFSLPREEYEKLSVNAIQLAKQKGIDILAEVRLRWIKATSVSLQ